MSKALAVAVALAVSSASAATVGVVAVRIVQVQNVKATDPSGGNAPETPPVKSAVVLNASKSLFDSVVADTSAERDGEGDGGCPSSDLQRCPTASHGSDVRLNILGVGPTLLPISLGGDSEDQYASILLEPIEFVFPVSRRRAIAGVEALGAQSGDGIQSPGESQTKMEFRSASASQNANDESVTTLLTSPDLAGLAMNVGFIAPTPDMTGPTPNLRLVAGDRPVSLLSAYSSFDETSTVNPIVSRSSPFVYSSAPSNSLELYLEPTVAGNNVPVPELSTWAMMGIGFTALYAAFPSLRIRARYHLAGC